MLGKENKDIREYLKIIQGKLDKIKKTSLIIQKYKEDAELAESYSRGIEEEVCEIERLLKECELLERKRKEPEDIRPGETNIFLKKNILLATQAGKKSEELREVLKELGAVVFWVTDGKKAIDAFQFSRSRTFDVILLDAYMPEKDGFLVAKAIRACDKENAGWIPLIALLSEENAENIRKVQDAGMDGWLCAPFEKKRVRRLILNTMKNK